MKILLKRSNLVVLAITVMVMTMVFGVGLAYATTEPTEELEPGTVEAISLTPVGEYGNDGSGNSDISADGQYVVFQSTASDLVAGDTNESSDVFINNRLTGETSLVSESEDGTQGNFESTQPSISADGLYVAFQSSATNLVDGEDSNESWDIFVRDMEHGFVTMMSVNNDGTQGNRNSTAPSVTCDGERVLVAYQSTAGNLVDKDINHHTKDVFVSYYWLNDPSRQVFTELVSRRTKGGTQGDDPSGDPSISGDGRLVAYESGSQLDQNRDTNSYSDIYVTDWQAETKSGFETWMVSRKAHNQWDIQDCYNPFISNDGTTISFDGMYPYQEMESYTTQVLVAWGWQDPEEYGTMPVSANLECEDWGWGDSEHSSLSADGRYVAFESDAEDLVSGDDNNKRDIFVRDLWAATGNYFPGITYLVSVDLFGEQANRNCGKDDGSTAPAITPSYDGVIPQVSFFSKATNLTYAVDGIIDHNDVKDVFVATLDPRPTITSITPVSGTTEGGTMVYIYGTNFVDRHEAEEASPMLMPELPPQELLSALGVTFGGLDAVSFTRVSTMKIIAYSPAHAAGKVQVQVTTPVGSTEDTAADDYTYIAPPVVPPVETPLVKKTGNVRYEQDNKHILYSGTWTTGESDGYSKASEFSTTDKLASITITFKGTRLDWIGALGPLFGKVMVSVDGGEAVEVDLNNATELLQQLVWSTGTLEYGVHVIKIFYPADLDASQIKPINIDALDVLGVLLDS